MGLAKHAYEVEVSDLSPQSIGRARKEAKTKGVDLKFSVSDMRKAYAHHSKQFDVLISCDNSVPHLLSDGEILKAFKGFYRCLKPGGGCLVTLRDYAKEPRDGIQFKSYGVRVDHGVRYVIFQTWEFHNDIYDMSMYLIYDDGVDQPVTKRFRSQYYAVSLPTILGLMQKAGFQDVKDIECDFYQPVIVGRRKI